MAGTPANNPRLSPTSSPSGSYDLVLAPESPSEHRPSSRSRAASVKISDDISVASDITHLEIPRTPAHNRARQPSPASELPDHASEYYTAAWGSPYQFSPSLLSRSARTAVSEQEYSDRFTNSSPGPSFSLEHLIPSRFNDPPSPVPRPSLLDVPAAGPFEEDNDHTPRSRTKRWAEVPYKPLARDHWWGEGSDYNSPSRDPSISRASSRGRPRGHKTREENRTLDQQSFWNILHEEKVTDMAGLQASRWAATPSEDESPAKMSAMHDSKNPGYFDEKPLPAPPADEENAAEDATRVQESSGAENTDAEPAVPEKTTEPPSIEVSENEHSKSESEQRNPADLVKPLPEPTRLAPPKLRKRVSWRGKNCIISIPKLDYDALGLMKPMSNEEFQERLKRFEDEGYDTRGFDISYVIPGDDMSMHAKPMWPDEAEMKQHLLSDKEHKVQLPNSKLWADYMEALTEARLAALGVSMGDDEPAPAPPSQDMSRQSSNQYPPLPFSPPLTTGSAASIGRPGMIRGHSHTMSMASPISPLNGPFGHMHRHSTFHGAFPGFVSPSQQAQDQPRQAPLPGLGNFSPITQSQLPRIGSPAQVTALRNELGGLRGPGSPLTNQILPQSTSDYSRGMIDDQRRRQHGYSQSVQVPSMSRNFSPQTGRLSIGPQPVLPELPEDEDEEELSDPQPYVPPAKRQQSGHEIAIPTPRGHRHNISEGLEREVMEAEQRRQEDEVRPFGGFGQLGSQAPMTNGFHPQINDVQPAAEEEETPIEEKDPLGGDFVVSQASRGHRKTGTRANIIAPPAPTPPVAPPASSFRFNPSAEFQPGASSFSFRPEPAQEPIAPPSATSTTHSRQKSSGHFNPAAVTFEPGNASTVPSSGFSFSASGPSFKVDAPAFQPTSTEVGSSDEGKIFGKVTIPEIVKPSKKSKAVPILQPSKANADSGTEVEDDEGRLKRGDERQKRQRAFGGSDGDEVPQFAEPTPTPVVPTQPADKFPVTRSPEGSPKRSNKDVEPEATKQNANKPVQAAAPSTYQKGHKKSSSSLSAMARPFVFHGPQSSLEQAKSPVKNTHVPQESISELEEGEIVEDEPAPVVPVHAANTHEEAPTDRDTTPSLSEPLRPYNLPDSVETSDEPRGEPTFDEIDAIMQQMNEVETVPNASPSKTISPPRSPDLQPPKGVTYIPGWPRSDAPSPSPKRQQLPYQNHNESSFTAHDRSDSGEQHQGMNGWPPQRLNKLDETAHSDWSGLLSPVDEDILQQRSVFFDSHIDSVIGRVVDRRLQPLEVSLRAIQNTVTKRARSVDQQLTLKPRSSSIAESDADDEDDVNDSQRQRPVSRGRDFKLGQIKSIVLEAIREQAPASSQSYHDIADLHSALADMKVSFARAASASLELEDIRLIVEEAVNRQPMQIAPPTEDSQESLREVKEMKNRLDETLANALEDANNRQQAEAREADVRRMLKLAEEELRLLRESSQDDDARLHALEQERQELRQRAEAAEQAHEQAEERCQSMEAQHEAMQATLEEYRTSSHRWRQEIDENKSERDELESNVSELEQRLVAQQEAADQERERLEKALADLEQRAFAEHEAAQLEKAELANATVQAEQRLRAEQEANKRERTEFELRLQKDHESGKHMREEFEMRLQAEREAHNRVREEFESRLQSAREAGNRMRDEFELRLQAELESGKREREELENTIVGLERSFEETQDSGNGMRRRLEKLHSDMATAAGQLATEKASWRAREEDYIARCEVLEAQNNVHMRERAALEEEARELRAVAAESTDARLSLDHMRSSKASLDEMVRKQQAELKEQQALTARWERDYHDARESARAEIHRTRMSLETDVEAANHQVNIVRAEYESELARVRAELDSVRMDADTAKERHAIMLEAESDEKREALRKVNHDNSVALDKARTNYDSAVEDLKAQHSRALRHAVEDKDRSEYFLNERLTLADAKLQHFQDRVLHLEERLEVTKSAAQAAAMSAQGKNSPAPNARSTIPEKISPQALRESILVLQEQLQERETRIEQLQQKAKTEGPAKIKERDTEIAWLRELLGVRSEELTELINALSRPTFDRDTVRDTAIRIRANLQMEQQEKERFGQSGSLPGQALASFTSFATPKATSLFNKWRNSMESNTLKSQQPSKSGSAAPSRSNTPSRPSVSARAPPSSFAGLMTPPATNLRSSPAPEATASVPAPALSRATSRKQDEPAPSELSTKAQGKQPVTEVETEQDHPSTPPELFAPNDYDHDAQDAPSQIPDFDDELEPDAEGDEDLDNVEDDQPPAFRSLEDELDEPESVTGAEEEGA